MFHITVTLVAIIIFSGYFGGLSIILKRLSVLLGMVTGLSVLLSMVTGLEKISGCSSNSVEIILLGLF